uniref:Uncharacterized protein n=1 Tax=Onchocerca volvulus TaxID=6282 RepID=A0A8R1Y1C4_ONCVO
MRTSSTSDFKLSVQIAGVSLNTGLVCNHDCAALPTMMGKYQQKLESLLYGPNQSYLITLLLQDAQAAILDVLLKRQQNMTKEFCATILKRQHDKARQAIKPSTTGTRTFVPE